ncbi:MAG: Gfo/Idh/MocA family oxidoreductase [Acidobacteriaceae bacterium]
MTESSAIIQVAVIGVGAFGRNHARVLHELTEAGKCRLAAAVDANPDIATAVAGKYGVPAFHDVEALIRARDSGKSEVDAAIVAVPTAQHRNVALALLQAGIDVLIEKPIASSVAEAEEIQAAAQYSERVAMVGQLERFNPAVVAARAMLTRPMFFECHRLSIFTPRSLDVDVVMDLMIHDLDVVLSMVDAPVREVRAVGLPVLTPKVDIANVRVEFESGCVANFTASRVSTERVRKVRFFQPHEYISIDYARQDLIRIQVDDAVLQALQSMSLGGSAVSVSQLPPSGEGSFSGVKISKPDVRPGEPLKAEIEEFLRAVRTRTAPLVSVAQGTRALRLALEIHARMEEHRARAGV